jgi:hypothetical protein
MKFNESLFSGFQGVTENVSKRINIVTPVLFFNPWCHIRSGLEDYVLQQFLYEMNTCHVEHFYEYKFFLDQSCTVLITALYCSVILCAT